MFYFYVGGLVVFAVVSFVLSFLAFIGKDIILDDAYIKASKEEREKMNKKAYRIQAGIVFLSIGLMTLCNFFRLALNLQWLTYVAAGIFIAALVYAIVSHYAIKKK